MSEIQKCPNLVRGGGDQHFSKMSEIQKCPKCRRGGRGQPLLGHCPKFSLFFSDASPKGTLGKKLKPIKKGCIPGIFI